MTQIKKLFMEKQVAVRQEREIRGTLRIEEIDHL